MATISIKAGETLSYGGTITNLDPTIDWGASIAFKPSVGGAAVTPAATLTLVHALDYSTTHNWDILIYAAPATTLAWFGATTKPSLLLSFDIKFFDTADPNKVIYTNTNQLSIEKAITP